MLRYLFGAIFLSHNSFDYFLFILPSVVGFVSYCMGFPSQTPLLFHHLTWQIHCPFPASHVNVSSSTGQEDKKLPPPLPKKPAGGVSGSLRADSVGDGVSVSARGGPAGLVVPRVGGHTLPIREKSLDLGDRQRTEARRRLLQTKRTASFRQNSATESADSIEIYIPEAQTRLWTHDGTRFPLTRSSASHCCLYASDPPPILAFSINFCHPTLLPNKQWQPF